MSVQIGCEPDGLTHSEYEVGDWIRTRNAVGNERVIRVTDKQEDIKDGRPGYNGKIVEADVDLLPPGKPVWGFDSNIVEVVEDGGGFPHSRVYHMGHS